MAEIDAGSDCRRFANRFRKLQATKQPGRIQAQLQAKLAPAVAAPSIAGPRRRKILAMSNCGNTVILPGIGIRAPNFADARCL